MKKFLMLIVAAMALVGARAAVQGYFNFEVSGGQAVITGLTTAAQSMNLSTLEIPGFIHYNGLVWPTRIRTSAFQGCKASDIIIHYGCQRIDNYAFSSCNNLQQLRIPSSVTYLGGGLILNSGKNSNSILVAMAGQEPLDEANMYSNAFVGALSTNGVDLGLSTRAAYNAFSSNSLIQGMGFKAIKQNAALANDYFDGNGTSYVVTKAATDMADGTMMLVGSTNEDVVVRSSMIYLDDYGATDFTHGYRCMEIADYAFLSSSFNVLPIVIKTLTWTGAPDGSKIGSFIFASGNIVNNTLTTINIDCDTIAASCFYACHNLTSLNFGEGVVAIESYAFEDCSELTTITLPASLREWGNSDKWGYRDPFLYCKKLKEIKSRSAVGENFFTYDSVLYQAKYNIYYSSYTSTIIRCPPNIDHYPKIYENATEIANYAFRDFQSIRGAQGLNGVLDFPRVNKVGDEAFVGAYIGALHFSSSCVEWGSSYGKRAFNGIEKIHAINFGNIYPPQLSSTDLTALFNSGSNSSELISVFCPYDAINEYKQLFSSTQTSVLVGGYDWVFDGLRYRILREPSSSTIALVKGTYRGNYNPHPAVENYLLPPVGEVVVPEDLNGLGVGVIDPEAFADNTGITSIELPKTITKIGKRAMAGTTGLQRLVVHMTTLPTLGSNVWDGIDQSTVTLVVPPGMKAAYAAADQWKDFGTIIEENVSYNLYVKGIQVTSSNCADILGDGTVTYDPVGNKLILNNVNYNESFNDYFIKNEIDGLQIVVNGENYIGPNVLRGISVGNNAKTTITGGGSLTIDVGQTGVYTCSLLTITGGVQLSSKGTYAYSAYNYAGITISNAMTRVKGYGTKSCLYNVNGLTLNDGLQIVEPEGAHMEGWTMMDGDGNILKNTWLVIAKSVAVPGDVNGDGEVTAADVTALYDYLLNNATTHLVNGDQTGDGEITAGDVTAVYNILLGN